MAGYGLVIFISVVTILLLILMNTCTDWPIQGFVGGVKETEVKETDVKETEVREVKEIPRPLNLRDSSLKNVTGTSSVTDLPSAPVSDLSEGNSLPQTDPAMEKSTLQMLNELKKDMDGFYKNEYPYMKDRSDPAINLPSTRFIGDYQRIKDEIHVLNVNKGIPSQVSIQELNDMGANLRYLQRSYRNLADVQLVPATTEKLSLVGTEGFVNAPVDTDNAPITLYQLKLLNTALGAEITRLKASGTTDPVINARVNIFMNMKQTVEDLITRVENESLDAAAIPIKVKDYKNFLPSLGTSTGPIVNLISENTSSTPSSPAAFLDKYLDHFIKGVSFSYTSPNDVAKQKALASYARSFESSRSLPGSARAADSRGEFDHTIRRLDAIHREDPINTLDAFENGGSVRPPSSISGNPGSFDWKGRAKAITENIKKAGLNPGDYGCLEDSSSVGSGFSWRGHSKMICSRLSTNADPGVPEQMGCPPVSWKGWRS
jgi:hypothetical protein